jgi:peptide/nickel transport system substrate-binding protein
MLAKTAARHGLPLLLVLAVAACAPAPVTNTPTAAGAAPTAAVQDPGRTLVIAVGRAPESLGSKPLRELRGPASPRTAQRVFNAGLAINDDRELPRPYLAEALPELNTESWRVSPDGRMETTYRLRPNLSWHDGLPLTAEDFVFAWHVYATPELGLSASAPFNRIEEVLAPDNRTVVIRWHQLHGEADSLQATDFPPLPRHILAGPFAQRDPEALVAQPFWIGEYVGLGPYRVNRWELGAFVEGEAFDGHALGRPRISRLRLVFISDPNTALASLLSEAIHMAQDSSIQQQQAFYLQREWASGTTGVVLSSPVSVRAAHFQLRPEYANPRAPLDVRIRKAVAQSTDRQSIADALTEGQGAAADSLILPLSEAFADAERVITKHPYDLRRAEQLFNDAGFAKGLDGFYTSPAEGRFILEIAVTDANPTEGTVMVDGLRRGGIDATLRVIPRAQTTEPLIFSNYSGILNGQLTRAFEPPITRFRASEIARPETRFLGTNFAGFNHPEFERLVAEYESALSRSERNQHTVQMLKVLSDELPGYGLYYYLQFVPHSANLRGPMVTVTADASAWNIHEWYWTK